MKRVFELEARANDVGYSVTLRINGRAFAASAIRSAVHTSRL